MSKIAKAQGTIWGRRHPEQVEAAVVEMAEEYRRQYSSDPGGKAIEFIEDESGAVAPELKAGSLAYSRMYPDEFKDAQVQLTFYQYDTYLWNYLTFAHAPSLLNLCRLSEIFRAAPYSPRSTEVVQLIGLIRWRDA